MDNEKKPSKQDGASKKEKGSFKESIDQIDDNIKERLGESRKNLSDSIDRGVKSTKSFFRKLVMGIFVLLLLSVAVFLMYANYTYSEGTRAGDLIKISRKGYVFKTYEGQLKLGGIDMENAEEGLSDTWSFSVKDEAIVEKLEKLQGQKVILRYKEINLAMPWQGDTNYFIKEVKRDGE